MSSFRTQLRSNVISELSGMDGQAVTVCGWISQPMKESASGSIAEVRDRSGAVELVLEKGLSGHNSSSSVRIGDVVRVQGMVTNKDGAYRLEVSKIEILSRTHGLPFNPWSHSDVKISAEQLASLRYLQLRKPDYQRRIELKSRALTALRSQLFRHAFLEVDLPILDHFAPSSTHSFVVPSEGGRAYALSETPQLYKHLMIAGGVDRFFQFSRVFRREKSYSAWHQPEFTSLDIEMAFAEEEDIFRVVDELISRLYKGMLNREFNSTITRLSYDDAILRYGTDTPDLRYGLEIFEIGDILIGGMNSYIRGILDSEGLPKGAVRAFQISSELVEKLPARRLELLPLMNPFPNQVRFDWLQLRHDGHWSGTLSDAVPMNGHAALSSRFRSASGSVLVVVSGANEHFVAPAAGEGRTQFAKELGLIKPDAFAPVWIMRFPYFGFDPNLRCFVPARHPLTMPCAEKLSFFQSVPPLSSATFPAVEKTIDGEGGGSPPASFRERLDYTTPNGLDYISLRSRGFELVLNGQELGSGSIRVHDVSLQEKILSMFGFSRAEAMGQFGSLLSALRHGVPPHGGMAIGVDRLLATLSGEIGIECFIPFPKNSRGECLVSDSPSVLDQGFVRSLLGLGT